MTTSFLLNKNNNNLDLLRILLSCFVIVGHSPTLNGTNGQWIDPIGHFFNFTYSGALAVKIFFFISGMLVTNSWLKSRSSLHFVVSRFFRLMPALFFVLLITVFIIGPIVTNLSSNQYFSSLDGFKYLRHNLVFNTDFVLPGVFVSNIYKEAVNGSLWSLKYEVACYIVLLGVFLVLGKKNKNFLNIPIAIIIIDSFLPTRIFLGWLGDNPEINLLPASFAFGSLYAVNSDKIEINLKSVLGIFLLFYVFGSTGFAQLIFVFAACNASLYIASNSFFCKLKPKYDISYGIYLWGFLVQQTLFHFIGSKSVLIHCLISITIAIILGFLTNIMIEKPFINFGKIALKKIEDVFKK